MILEGDTLESDNGSGAEDESMPVAKSSGRVSSLFPYVFVGSVALNGGVVCAHMQVSVTSSKEQFVDKLVTFLEQDRKASLKQSTAHVSNS